MAVERVSPDVLRRAQAGVHRFFETDTVLGIKSPLPMGDEVFARGLNLSCASKLAESEGGGERMIYKTGLLKLGEDSGMSVNVIGTLPLVLAEKREAVLNLTVVHSMPGRTRSAAAAMSGKYYRNGRASIDPESFTLNKRRANLTTYLEDMNNIFAFAEEALA